MSKQATAETQNVNENGFQDAQPKPIRRDPWWKLGGKDFCYVTVDAGYTTREISPSSSDIKLESAEPLGQHVFETAESTEIYKPIQKYEGRHRFDPSAEWTAAEEKALVKTV